MPEVLATYDGEGQPRDTFAYGLQRLAGIGPEGKSTVYVNDGLGSVRQLADAQGAVFDRYTYSPHGLPAANGRLNPSHKLNDGNTFGFGGQDHDPVFGQVYLRARYYAPGLGRFTAPDPLVMTGLDLPGMSPYAYGWDNPLAYLDPSGLVVEKVNKGLTATLAALETGLSVAGAAISVVMLATMTVATPVGWVAFAAAAVLTASHFIGAVHDVGALAQGHYGEVGGGDRLYNLAGDAGVGGQYGLMAFETVVFRIPSMRGVIRAAETATAGRTDVSVSPSVAQEGYTTASGTKVCRVYGGEASPMGHSWTPVDPREVSAYRDMAGLPDKNTGRFLVEGKITDPTGITVTKARPYESRPGGLPEFLVPSPERQIEVIHVLGLNPEF